MRAPRIFGLRRHGAIVLTVIAIALTCLPARSAPLAPLPADQVGYASADVGTSWSYRLSCGGTGSLSDWMFAVGTEFSDGWLPSDVIIHPPASTTGKVFQVGDKQLVTEERVEIPPPSRPSQITVFGLGYSVGGSVLRNHFAWAFWGDHLTCTLKVDGVDVATQYLEGSHAIYVAPEAFTGGVFSQDGAHQTALGRSFARDTSGGPVFIALQPWGADRNPVSTAFVVTDDPYRFAPVESCHPLLYGVPYCQIGRPNVSPVVAGIAASDNNDGTGQELWMIDIPASAVQ